MQVPSPTFWWVVAGIVVAVELGTGTFYLLMVAIGLVAAALAAHFGLTAPQQIVVAALVGGGATAALHWRRARGPRSALAPRNRDVNLDIGERVQVSAWSPERTARVQHRGAAWSARLERDVPAMPGEHVVVAVEGNWLVLTPFGRSTTASEHP